MTHIYRPGERILVLFHGTGGDENDLIPLAESVAPDFGILSLRGEVNENGMPRFFRRFAEGVFDHQDVAERQSSCAEFLSDPSQPWAGLPLDAIGFSNGANMIGVMLQNGFPFERSVLIRPMLVTKARLEATGTRSAMLLSGSLDPICTPEQGTALAESLRAAGVEVDHRFVQASHNLTREDVALSAGFLAQLN